MEDGEGQRERSALSLALFSAGWRKTSVNCLN